MKNKFYLLAITLMFAATSVTTHAATIDKKAMDAKVAAMTTEQKKERAVEIKLRVEEILAMNKSGLNSAERKELRQELRSMKMESKSLGNGGVYISLAGIVIIILLLILIL